MERRVTKSRAEAGPSLSAVDEHRRTPKYSNSHSIWLRTLYQISTLNLRNSFRLYLLLLVDFVFLAISKCLISPLYSQFLVPALGWLSVLPGSSSNFSLKCWDLGIDSQALILGGVIAHPARKSRCVWSVYADIDKIRVYFKIKTMFLSVYYMYV